MTIRKARLQDLPRLCALINDQNNGRISERYLEHWYFKNPSRSFSLQVLEEDDSILGVASTNNFNFDIQGSSCLVAMPQKVLTAERVRGKGFFGKLYRAGENENKETHGIQDFLTITNAASTPIFRKKFGYLEGVSPTIHILPSLPFLGKHYDFESCVALPKEHASLCNSQDWTNGLIKNADHFSWRFHADAAPDNKGYEYLRIKDSGSTVAVAVLKAAQRKGVPYYYLMSLLQEAGVDGGMVMNACRKFARSKAKLALFVMENSRTKSILEKCGPSKTVSKRFNFLVNATDKRRSEKLAQMDFNLEFGDLDFL